MSGPKFFQTMMGKIYYESTMPRLVKALEKIGKCLEEKEISEDEVNKQFRYCQVCGTIAHIDNMIEDGEYDGITHYSCDSHTI